MIKRVIKKIGIDKAIAYTSGARVIQGFTGVISVFFITSFLSGVEQGFYYTFGSILALQVFFELGLTGIVTQYVAHEASHLSLNTNNEYEGEPQYISRLASLFRFCIKWYSLLAIIVFFFLLFTGFVYFIKFGKHSELDISWRIPWILMCIGTSINFIISPLNSILSGLGYIKETSKISFYQQIIIPCCTWIGLVCGFKLYVLSISYLISILIWGIFIIRMRLSQLLINLGKIKIKERVCYMEEIFPYQWKIALSWISGYFIFQLFNPVLFATEGAIVAGQMGLTLQALNAISALSSSWINTKIPMMSNLIAQKQYIALDHLFYKILKQMLPITIGLFILFFFFVFILRILSLKFNENIIADRFIPYMPLLMMMGAMLLQQIISAWATYIRCHKREPFLLFSIVNAAFCVLSTLFLGKEFGLYGITLGYLIIQCTLLPWAYWLFHTNKNKWHH